MMLLELLVLFDFKLLCSKLMISILNIRVLRDKKQTMKYKLYIIIVLFLSSCATYQTQYDKNHANWKNSIHQEKEELYSIYLIGDAGKLDKNGVNIVTQAVGEKLKTANKQNALIYLGDNIYPVGMPKKGKKKRNLAEDIIDAQLKIVKDFKGKTIFIPGNYDWYQGLEGLRRQEKYIERELSNKKIVFPKNGCPLQKIKVNDDIVIIAINSQWYLENWDKNPTINDDCEIKTRSKFFDELEGLIKKSVGKTTIIAMHHPVFSNGSHGGQFTLKHQIKPAPILGSLISLLRKTGGVSPQDIQNKRYLEFKNRIVTLAQFNSKVIFVSGHDHNLQYIKKNNVHQIISGSGAKVSGVRNKNDKFAYPNFGYAKLIIYKDGSSNVEFYGVKNKKDKLVYLAQVIPTTIKKSIKTYENEFPNVVESNIYSYTETNKSKVYQTLWGKRYRNYFSKKINAPTVNLDTLFGGLIPKRKGGGHQSISLVLKNKEGKEYVMRALRKSATKYLQAVAFKDQYIDNQFDNTVTEGLLLDVFTAAHPYAPFTIADLSDAVNVYHTNPKLYFVPKQNALNEYNDEYGDALYMIEERATSGHGDLASFGFSDKIISTDDMLKKMRKNGKYTIDQASYIRARLFDMVIGDWDRHEDQWRWAEFKDEDDNKFFRPIPRDRDQAFSLMGSGVLLGIATRIVPTLRLMKSYDRKLKSPKWFNLEPYPLDMALINGTDKLLWDEQVAFIKTNLTKEVITKAFAHFPKEVKDKTIVKIERKLLGRIKNLQRISDLYYKQIHKNIIVKGTDKKDWFEIIRLPKGKTRVIAYQNKKDILKNPAKGKVYFDKTFNHRITHEISIYGLDKEDHFKVSGSGTQLIPIRITGGQNNDIYHIINGKKIIIQDYKSKKNTFITTQGKRKLIDDYDMNVYDYKKAIYNSNQLIPSIGSNKDDGLKIGFTNIYTNQGFHRDHFVQKQTFSANYFKATDGFEFSYKGEFAKVFGNFKLNFDAVYTSPNYSLNFFGFGNETQNFDDNQNDDFNRVKIKTLKFTPSMIKNGSSGGSLQILATYENLEAQKTTNRFVEIANQNNEIPNFIFKNQNYLSADIIYKFENSDNKVFPTLGLKTSFQLGFKNNLDTNKSFGYLIPVFGFDYRLNPKGSLVFATKFKGHINFNNNFEFYHAASIGANDGLRGFRNQRFTGKDAYYQNIDLRYKFNKRRTVLMPLNFGIFIGLDYGRIWLDNDQSRKWHSSFGGGFIMNMSDLMAFKIGAFNSGEGTLTSFGFNVDF